MAIDLAMSLTCLWLACCVSEWHRANKYRKIEVILTCSKSDAEILLNISQIVAAFITNPEL